MWLYVGCRVSLNPKQNFPCLIALCVGTAGRIPKVKVKQGQMFRGQPCTAVYSALRSPSLLKDRLHRGRRDYSNQMEHLWRCQFSDQSCVWILEVPYSYPMLCQKVWSPEFRTMLDWLNSLDGIFFHAMPLHFEKTHIWNESFKSIREGRDAKVFA